MHNTYCQSRNYINCCYNNPVYPPNENAVSNNTSHNNINKANSNCNNVNFYSSVPAPTAISNINRHNNKEIFYPWSYNHVTTTPAVQAANGITVNEKCISYNYNNYNNNYDYNYNLNNKCDYSNVSTPQTSNCTPKAYDYRYQWPLSNNSKTNYTSYQHQNTITQNSNLSSAPIAHYNYENRLHENTFINSHQSTVPPPPTHPTTFHHQQTSNNIQSNSRLKQSSNSATLDYYQHDSSKTFLNSNLTHPTYYKQCFVPRYPEPNPHKNSISIRNPFEYPDESCTKTASSEPLNYDAYKKSHLNLINYEMYKKPGVDFPVNYEGYRKPNTETPTIAWNTNYINELPNSIPPPNTDITRHQRYISQENIWVDKRYVSCSNYSTTSNNFPINNKIIEESSSNCAYESRHINSTNYTANESIANTLPNEFPLNDFYNPHHHQPHIDYYNINNQLLPNNINTPYEYERYNVQENINSKESVVCGQAIRDFISNWNEEEDEDTSLQTIDTSDAKLNSNENYEDNNKIKDQIKEEVITEEDKEKTTLLKIEKIENEEIKTELIEDEKELNEVEKNNNNSEIIKPKDQDSASPTIKNLEIKSRNNIKKIKRNQKRNKSFQSNLRKERYKIIRKIYKIKCFYTKYILPKNKFLYKKVPLSKRSTNLMKNSKANKKKPNFADYKTIKRTYKKRLQKLRSKNKTVSNLNSKSEPDIKENNTDIHIVDDNHDSNSTKSDIPSLIDICEQFIINETIKSGCNLNVYLYEAYNYNNNNNFDESDCSNDDNNVKELINTTTETTVLDETNKSCTTLKTCNDTIDTTENNENICSSQNLEKNENISISIPSTSSNYADSNSNIIIDENSQINNSNSNSSSPPPSLSIHHEEIVAENTQKFHLEKFAKDLRTKYLNKCTMKNYFISKLYKRYKWRTKF